VVWVTFESNCSVQQPAAAGEEVEIWSVRVAASAADAYVRRVVAMVKTGFILSVMLVALYCTDSLTDVLMVSNVGNTIIPLNDSLISMESEEVHIWSKGALYQIDCTYLMKSHARHRITGSVGFPLASPAFRSIADHFVATVDGSIVQTELRMNADSLSSREGSLYSSSNRSDFNYPGYIIWTMSWEPEQARTIQCSYEGGGHDDFGGLVEGERLKFVVRTGALWRGPIGKALIIAELYREPLYRFKFIAPSWYQDPFVRISYAQHATWTSDRRVEWSFENWEPDTDIVIEAVGWIGIRGLYYSFWLPEDYVGMKEKYSESYMEKFVEAEMSRYRDYYPKKIQALNRDLVRYAIADFLQHELLARHQFAFAVRTDSVSKHIIHGADGSDYGKWGDYFLRYRIYDRHTGWFDGKSKKSMSEAMGEFNECENFNYTFLGEFKQKLLDRLTPR
jgi:hypothetical protein